ncbi:hypothetical protein TcWFU_006409 [Taenia crassiceps]|uniref:Uncharacterized protein n=1 Tax=Taenia crassiceps TaxID=6207 RepID=A0ABR4Q5P3_9CEST
MQDQSTADKNCLSVTPRFDSNCSKTTLTRHRSKSHNLNAIVPVVHCEDGLRVGIGWIGLTWLTICSSTAQTLQSEQTGGLTSQPHDDCARLVSRKASPQQRRGNSARHAAHSIASRTGQNRMSHADSKRHLVEGVSSVVRLSVIEWSWLLIKEDLKRCATADFTCEDWDMLKPRTRKVGDMKTESWEGRGRALKQHIILGCTLFAGARLSD